MRRLFASLLILICVAGCTRASPDSVTVYAASSLTDAFTEIGEQFEHRTGRSVAFNFAGSQTLRLQIEHGAPADIFATADVRHLDALIADGHVSERWSLASTDVVPVVATDSRLRSFDDLAAGERVVVGADTVPVGTYTQQLFARARGTEYADVARHLRQQTVSRENNVRVVRSKVLIGVADVGFVYRTDAQADGLRLIEVPPQLRVGATYGVGLVAPNGQDFVEFLRSDGAAVLQSYGFEVTP